VDGEDVIAVDAEATEAEPARALCDRDCRLTSDRDADRVLVVLAEEHDRCVVDGREVEGLHDIALAARAVAEVGDDGGVALRITSADRAVEHQAHGVAGGMQGLGADDDARQTVPVLCRVPSAELDAANPAEEVGRLHAAAPGHAVVAVGAEGKVLGAQGAAGSDLGSLLAKGGWPQTDLAMSLESERLGVDAAGQHEIAVQTADRRVIAIEVELGVLDALAFWREQLDERKVVTDLVGHGCAHATPSSRPVARLSHRFDLVPDFDVRGW
jgi:hypothetical protein